MLTRIQDHRSIEKTRTIFVLYYDVDKVPYGACVMRRDMYAVHMVGSLVCLVILEGADRQERRQEQPLMDNYMMMVMPQESRGSCGLKLLHDFHMHLQ